MFRQLIPLVLVCFLGANVTAAEEPAAPVAIPKAQALEEAEKLVRELFKADFAKTLPKSKLELAEKLFRQAGETTDDRAAQFVLYHLSAELAASVGQVDLALQAIEALRERYTGVGTHTETVLRTLTTRPATPDAWAALTNYLLRLTDEAVEADDLDAAERFVRMAQTTATRSRQLRIVNYTTSRAREIGAFQKEADAVKGALATLEKDASDPAASTIAGKYYCFQKGDWAKGLPLLAKGDDKALKAAAEKDVAKPTDANDRMDLADLWYDAGKAAPVGYTKRAMLSHAYELYDQVAPDLTGLSRTKADKRLDELEKVAESVGQYDELWSAVRTAVRVKETEDLGPVGGIFGSRKAYREGLPSAVLIGFYYGTRQINNHDVIGYLQPIYLTSRGEKYGAKYGRPPAKPLVVKAKPGYAIGALNIRGGGHLEAFSVTFMKIQGKGLNAADKYDSEWMGRDMSFGGTTVGDGRPVLGIFGKLLDRDPDICTIGLIVAGPKPKR